MSLKYLTCANPLKEYTKSTFTTHKKSRVLSPKRRKNRIKWTDGFSENVLKDLSLVDIYEKLGEGDFGAVYKGKYLNKTVAIKMVWIKREKSLDDEEYYDFLAEGKMMLEMKDHPNVVKVEWICINRECPAIVMEYAKNGTLRDYLVSLKEDLSLSKIIKLIFGIAKGISALHSAGIVHRDIAARNILLGENLIPKLSDFGLSRKCQKEGDYFSRGLHAVPVKWMAPESIGKGKFSTQTDVWSFGILMWEVLTRDLPHKDLDTTECKIMIRDNFLTPTVPSQFARTPINDLIKQCWYSDPEMRISARDIAEFLEDL